MGETVEIKEGKYTPLLRQCFVTASVAINIVGHGCVIGFPAILIPSLRKSDSHIHLTRSEESWIASVVGFALIVGNFIITLILDNIGRKKSHILTIFPNLAGWFLFLLVNNFPGLMAARFLQGIAMGMLGPLGSIIIGEMTDPKSRGVFLTSVSLSLTLGVLSSHALGTCFTWQISALLCSLVTFISLCLIIFTPESPSWLLSKGRYDEAREGFFWLRGKNAKTEHELERMITSQKMTRKASITGQKDTVKANLKNYFRYLSEAGKKPEFVKPVVIMVFLYIMFQFAGINVISSYATDILAELLDSEANSNFLMVALDIERLICNLIAIYLMKTLKRRTLLFSTTIICILAYISKGSYVYAKQAGILTYDSQWIPITLIGIYMFSLTVGVSSIPFALSGELFPLDYRGLGGGVSYLALSLNFFIAVKCFPVLSSAIGLSFTYFLYAGIVTICMVVVWIMLPETKDKTLQEIEDRFRGYTAEDVKSSQPLNAANGGGEMMRRCSSHILY
ncbi:facilitated trehalose transporter Tret1-like [Bombyx mandarina]|uniref:Major facilitator superfamily (MFS) profile domain-containing protein n=2 Tax=Bombyx TaxID=7090 RepID=A0A8R1WKM1_BOMMO|nr:facilitated trehalose transporter Tret1 [Bombyx mori]XP_028044338.1 facilitated trehalose transporter Tret1-like [Bombyx mandarina]